MTLTELRYIVALHKTNHFGKAAEICFVSQPTLSVAIKKLEDELGIAVFERSRGKVIATPQGEKIIKQAQVVLDQVNVIKDLAEVGRNPLASSLAIGAIYTVGPYLFPHFVPALRELAPQMPLFIEESYTAELRHKLTDTELDAIIVALPFNEPDVVTRPLYEEPFVVLLPADHQLAKEKAIDPNQLVEETVLLLGEGHCFRDQVLDYCPTLVKKAEHGQRLQSVVEGSSLETLKHMVASGMGVTVLPASAAQLGVYGKNKLVIRPFVGKPPVRTIALAWRASFPRPQAIELICDAIKSQDKSILNQSA